MSKKEKPPEVAVSEPDERLLDETIDYIVIVEAFPSSMTLMGTDQRYGILNKQTGVVEMRFNCYSEAIQGLMLCQDSYDKWYTVYQKKMGMIN